MGSETGPETGSVTGETYSQDASTAGSVSAPQTISQPGGVSTAQHSSSSLIDPAPGEALARLTRWRSRLGDALAAEGRSPSSASVGDSAVTPADTALTTTLDHPHHRLQLLKVFGEAPFLSDLSFKYPATAARALAGGAGEEIAGLSKQLSSLDWGAGGIAVLRQVLVPIKERADLALSMGLIAGSLDTQTAAQTRTDLAERLCEAALAWLVRSAMKRGEFALAGYQEDTPSPSEEAEEKFGSVPLNGLFLLAGGDFSHQDTDWTGPLDVAILYDPDRFQRDAISHMERVLVRISVELRDVLEGKSGERALYHLHTPFGSKINGAGLIERTDQVLRMIATQGADSERAWLASARVIAGDRHCGGAFLEAAEAPIWAARPFLRADHTPSDQGPLAAQPLGQLKLAFEHYRAIGTICRATLGHHRPVFRIAPTAELMKAAQTAGLVPALMAERFVAGVNSLAAVRDAAYWVDGPHSSVGPLSGALHDGHAILSGFDQAASLQSLVAGFYADAQSCHQQLLLGPRQAFGRYMTAPAPSGDASKLEDLGFADGSGTSVMIETWRQRADGPASDDSTRFAERAPGLLTAFGETQYPNRAVAQFDRLLTAARAGANFNDILATDDVPRAQLVDGLGCFPDALDALIDQTPEDLIALCTDETLRLQLANPDFFVQLYPLPPIEDGGDEKACQKTLIALRQWQGRVMAHLAFCATDPGADFARIADAAEAVHGILLSALYRLTMAHMPAGDRKGLQNLALFAMAQDANSLAGQRMGLGFILTSRSPAKGIMEKANRFAQDFTAHLAAFEDGFFGIRPDLTIRPGGPTGTLVAGASAWQQFVRNDAKCHDQIALARAVVFAGNDKARHSAAEILRDAGENVRRAHFTVRDLDRVRAQRRLRPASAQSDGNLWAVDQRDGTAQDIDLMISILFFRHAASHPFLSAAAPREALLAMADAGLIEAETAHSLIHARDFWRQINVVKAFSAWQSPDASPIRKRFGVLLARACGVSRFEQTGPILRGYADDGARLYALIVQGRDDHFSVAS
ncbi:MAG: hypothetical protein AAFR72_12520 [Pseudomonadota bacterium]